MLPVRLLFGVGKVMLHVRLLLGQARAYSM